MGTPASTAVDVPAAVVNDPPVVDTNVVPAPPAIDAPVPVAIAVAPNPVAVAPVTAMGTYAYVITPATTPAAAVQRVEP